MATEINTSILNLTMRQKKKIDSLTIFDGDWTRCATLRTDCIKQVSLLGFGCVHDAFEAFQFLDGLNHPNVPKVYGLEEAEDAEKARIIVDRLPPVRLREWINYKAAEEAMWIVNSSGTQYLELKKKYQQFFKAISETIFHLHEREKSHGNLLSGVWVSDPSDDHVEIKLCNFDMAIDFESGFKKDMDDLKKLVELTVKKHPMTILINGKLPKPPPVLKSFFELYEKFNALYDFTEMREFAIFLYCAPIFWGWQDRLKFLYLLEFFSKQDFDGFSLKIILDGLEKKRMPGVPPKVRKNIMPEMKNWQDRIKNLLEKDPVKELYALGKDRIKYQSSGGIYWLHRNATHHYGGVLRDGDQREPAMAAMQDLLSIFPDALPCIFKKVIEVFHIKEKRNSKFRKSITVYLKEGLQAYLKEGLLGPGLIC